MPGIRSRNQRRRAYGTQRSQLQFPFFKLSFSFLEFPFPLFGLQVIFFLGLFPVVVLIQPVFFGSEQSFFFQQDRLFVHREKYPAGQDPDQSADRLRAVGQPGSATAVHVRAET